MQKSSTPAPTQRERVYESLLRESANHLKAWQTKYGQHGPSWMPQGGDVKLLETIDDWLKTADADSAPDPLTGRPELVKPMVNDALQNIVALSAGWDDLGSTGPKPPLSWESVGRMAMDYARAALESPQRDPENLPVSPEPALPDNVQAVLKAAQEWSAERFVKDWTEADLMKTISTLDGDWPGCEGCNHDCGEPCEPATVSEMHRSVDHQIAQLVHDGDLPAHDGYRPPQGFKPQMPRRRRTIPIALASTEGAATKRAIATKRDPTIAESPIVVAPALINLIEAWERRSRDALPADAMLVNKHIRELREALGSS